MSEEHHVRESAVRLPVATALSDHPILEVGLPAEEDSFQFEARLAGVYDILRHRNTNTPITIAICGDWGCGKSSAMRWLQSQLRVWGGSSVERGEHPRVHSIWFEPWKYSTREEVWRGLISEVVVASIQLEGATVERVKFAAKQFGAFLGRAFLRALASTAVKIPAIGAEFEVKGSVLQEIYNDLKEVNHPEKPYLNEFEDTLRRWVTETLGENERMVLFIDDLDRCLPAVALEVLEALKLYLSIPRIAFVVGIDRAVVDAVVRKHYSDQGVRHAAKAEQYLDKIFQVEVDIAPTQNQIRTYVSTQMRRLNELCDHHWDKQLALASAATKGDFGSLLEEKVTKLCRDNPREVKRLLNSAILRALAAEQRADLPGDPATRFAQGAQVFLVGRFLDRGYGRGASAILLREDVQQFFCDWSVSVRATVEAGNNAVEPQVSNLSGRQPEFKGEHLPVLSDRELSDLLQIPFSVQVAGATAAPSDKASWRGRIPTQPPLVGVEVSEPFASWPSLPMQAAVRVARSLDKPIDELEQGDAVRIQSLDLSGTDLEEVGFLKEMHRLQQLILAGTRVSDLSPLESLSQLVTLDLSSCHRVSDLGKLSRLTRLVELGLEASGVDDVAPIAGLAGLRKLNLASTAVCDLSPLAAMVGLSELSFARTKTRSLEPLKRLGQLNSLDASDSEVGDLTPLAGLVRLQVLNLAGTRVTDVSPLEKLVQLRVLNLAGTSLAEVTPLLGLPINDLDLSHSALTSVEDLALLRSLRELSLVRTPVTDLSPLQSARALRVLRLERNESQTRQVESLKQALPDLIVRWESGSPADEEVGASME